MEEEIVSEERVKWCLRKIEIRKAAGPDAI